MNAVTPTFAAVYAKDPAARHMYPTEFVIRTFLGRYPRLQLDQSRYRGAAVLDLGCGDGRNLPLLHNLGMTITAVEVDEATCNTARVRAAAAGIPCAVHAGINAHLPLPSASFDYVLACHSCYYVTDGETFADNAREIGRVMRADGTFVFSLPTLDNYILRGADARPDNHFVIRNDPYGLRNGTLFRAFATEDEVRRALAPTFEDVRLGLCRDDFYGIEQNYWIGAARRSD